jgi:hypothetical protein
MPFPYSQGTESRRQELLNRLPEKIDTYGLGLKPQSLVVEVAIMLPVFLIVHVI